jgi:hypothetical protein
MKCAPQVGTSADAGQGARADVQGSFRQTRYSDSKPCDGSEALAAAAEVVQNRKARLLHGWKNSGTGRMP